jgi:hypothetical protein
LKLEYRILNQLTDIAQERLRTSQDYFSDQSQSFASDFTNSLATGNRGSVQNKLNEQVMISPLDVESSQLHRIDEKSASDAVVKQPARTVSFSRSGYDDVDMDWGGTFGNQR